MKHKKYIAISLTALLTFGSAQTALAKVINHDLSTDGPLKISSSGDEYVVTSSGETPTGCTIIVEEGVKDGVVTHIVLNGVNIETTNENGIKIGSNANVVLELDGTNSITVNTESYDTAKAGINVANGKLTIKGDGSLDVKVIDNGSPSDGADGAAIGSDEDEDFTGTIIIEGGNITAVSEYGAGIGSGYNSEMSGSITISGGEVEASSSYGAGIGSGWEGEMSGSITISGGEVTASSNYNGAGIGSGNDSEMSGTITISGGEVTASSYYFGAGIGAGDNGDMTGTINISGGYVKAHSDSDGTGIGSGEYGKMSGTINISGGTVIATSDDDGAGIGSGYDGEMSGTITISGGKVTASSDDDGAGIGSGWYGEMSGTGTITISGGKVTASSGEDGAGIGSGFNSEMSGSINISGGEVEASSSYSAGIGSGLNSEMSGKITISGGEVTASSGYYGTGIGAGDFGDITESGSITIGGDATVTANSDKGLGIGSGDYGNMNGTITITDYAKVDITLGDTSNKTGIGAGERSDDVFNGSINILEHANVELKYDDPEDTDYEGTPNIGSVNPDSTGEITLSTGATINGTQASDVEALKELGILNDNAGTTTVEPTPEPENPDSRNTYSLKQLNLVQRINEAEGGEVVAVSEKQLSKGKLPAYALEALAKKENVTLAILCEKFDILIPSDEAVKDAGSTQFYTIDELVEMYE